jgi:hypothetical protein
MRLVRRLQPDAGQSSVEEVEKTMGAPGREGAQTRRETWYYYPRQPYGRKVFVARIAPDGRLIALEQRLNDENVARIVPNATRAEQVRDLFGPALPGAALRQDGAR